MGTFVAGPQLSSSLRSTLHFRILEKKKKAITYQNISYSSNGIKQLLSLLIRRTNTVCEDLFRVP